MFNFDYITNEDKKENNPKWTEISDHPYWILITGGSISEKTNALLNLINHEPDIDKMFLYAKYPYKEKYELLINKRESTGLKCLNDSKAFLNTHMIWMIFIKKFNRKILVKNKNINCIWWYDC